MAIAMNEAWQKRHLENQGMAERTENSLLGLVELRVSTYLVLCTNQGVKVVFQPCQSLLNVGWRNKAQRTAPPCRHVRSFADFEKA